MHTVRHQAVIISCFNAEHKAHIQQLLSKYTLPASALHFYIVPSNDNWTRDHGPITVQENNSPVLRKFNFNGWGNKYKHNFDNAVVDNLAAQQAFADYTLTHRDWILEGGSIETDGQHTLLTTESCLLNTNRNPQLTRQQIEELLLNDLGMERVLWIKNSFLSGDDTDGHIDMLARFCDPHTICYATPHPENKADQASLLGLAKELALLRTTTGEPYRLVPLPAIKPKFDDDGKQLPASYANFLIINDAVLVPTYEDASDQAALDCLQHCFPQRTIIGIPALALVHQYGSIHCATMNIYARNPS